MRATPGNKQAGNAVDRSSGVKERKRGQTLK